MAGGSKATGDALDRDISAAAIPFPPSSLVVGHDGIPKGDKLVLRGLKFHGFHGVKAEERTLGQKFVVDMDVWMDLRAAGKSDRLSDTLSYTDIYRIVKEVVEGSAHNLLESVAEHISCATLTRYPQVSAVRIQVGKPHVAVQGSLDYLGVEIVRCRVPHIYVSRCLRGCLRRFMCHSLLRLIPRGGGCLLARGVQTIQEEMRRLIEDRCPDRRDEGGGGSRATPLC